MRTEEVLEAIEEILAIGGNKYAEYSDRECDIHNKLVNLAARLRAATDDARRPSGRDLGLQLPSLRELVDRIDVLANEYRDAFRSFDDRVRSLENKALR